MANYYFLSSLLPELKIGEPSPLSFHDLDELFEANLLHVDYEKTVIVRRMIDIENIRRLWQGNPVDHRGNLTDKDIEEALLIQDGLPEYVFNYIEEYSSDEDRLQYFSSLTSNFFVNEIRRNEGFLRDYLSFERDWRLVMLGFRVKRLGRDVSHELQFEDSDDMIVAQMLAQKDSKKYEPPDGYEDLKPIFKENVGDPLKLYKALCEYRFKRVEKLLVGELFSIERILGFLVQLIIVEKWNELDHQEGKVIVNKVVKALS